MNTDKIKVFISYTWDNEKHMEWVLRLAKKLGEDMRISVVLDRERMHAGGNLNHFADKHINEADKIIIIFTEEYKTKAVNRTDAAGYEYSIINTIISRNIAAQERVIPVLKKGNVDTSIPEFMQAFVHIDFSDPRQFASKYRELQYAILKEGKDEIPPPGRKVPWYKNGYLVIGVMIGVVLVIIVMYNYKILFFSGSKKDSIENANLITPVVDKNDTSVNTEKSGDINPAHSSLPGNTAASKPVNKHVYRDAAISCCEIIKRDGKIGFVDSKGRDISGASTVQFKYFSEGEFNEGLAKVAYDSQYGFIDRHGNIVIPVEYEAAESFSSGKANVRKNGHWFYIDKNNKCVQDCPPDM